MFFSLFIAFLILITASIIFAIIVIFIDWTYIIPQEIFPAFISFSWTIYPFLGYFLLILIMEFLDRFMIEVYEAYYKKSLDMSFAYTINPLSMILEKFIFNLEKGQK